MSNPDDSAPADSFISKEDGLKYWEGVSADVNGMLGGIPAVQGFHGILRTDLQGSRTFLAKLGIGSKNGRHKVINALEGGAGIGRVTEGLLLPIAEQVDVVEPVAKFTAALQNKPGVRNVFNVGLQDWRPTEDVRYDLIWVQWCVGHLTDIQLVEFLGRCQEVLSPDGIICLKENQSTKGYDDFDEEDSSVTREDTKFRSIFEQANMKLVATEPQRGLPETGSMRLLPVRMYALKPMA
ncbi:alpha-N-methyltransferase NTM1 [Trichoderma sp. SZMC 28015]